MNAFRVNRLRHRKKSDLDGSPSFRLPSSIDDLGDLVSFRLDEHRVLVHDTIAIVALHGVGAGIEFRLCFSLSRLFYLTRTETGMPRLVMRLRTLQPIFASVF